jgi:hypothetical protein
VICDRIIAMRDHFNLAPRTHEYHDRDGHVISFEIRNIGRSRATRVIESAFPCASVKRSQSDAFAEIDFKGRRFVFNEPWGDSSRYIIHQQPPGSSTELEELRHAFERYRPSLIFSGGRSFKLLMLVFGGLLIVIVFVITWLS